MRSAKALLSFLLLFPVSAWADPTVLFMTDANGTTHPIAKTIASTNVNSSNQLTRVYSPNSGYSQIADKSVLVSSVSGFPSFTAANTSFMRSTGRVGLSVSAATLGANATLTNGVWALPTIQPVVTAFANTSGSLTVQRDQTTTPDLPQYRVALGTADGTTKTFSVNLGNATAPLHFQLLLNGVVVAKDDGNGNLTGSAGNGTINYSSGAVSFTFTSAPTVGSSMVLGFWLSAAFSTSFTLPSGWTQVWETSATDAWPTWVSNLNFHPGVAFLDTSLGVSSAFTQQDLTDFATATTDITTTDPDIKRVYPILSLAGVTTNATNFGSSPYWVGAQNLIQQQGGVVLDIPAGYYQLQSSSYHSFVASILAWGVQNNVTVLVELSPYSLNSNDCGGNSCSNSPDPYFMQSVQRTIWDLQNQGALPSAWFISQYATQTTAPQPGTDNLTSATYNANTIDAVARWVAENAPTSPYPQSQQGIQSPGYMATSVTLQNGNPTLTPTKGSDRGGGTLGQQNSNNAYITGGALANVSLSNLLPIQNPLELAGSPCPSAVVNTTGLTVCSNNNPGSNDTDFVSTIGSGTGAFSFYSANAAGVINQPAASPLLSISASGTLTSLNGYILAGTTPAKWTTDGQGNVSFDPGSSSGTITIPANLKVQGTLNATTYTGNASQLMVTATGSNTVQSLANWMQNIQNNATGSYLPLSGGTLSGKLTANGGISVTGGLTTDTFTTTSLLAYDGAQFSYDSGSYTDPNPNVTRDAKFGEKGIAWLGGAVGDTLSLSGTLSVTGSVTVPTVSASDNSNNAASTAYVTNAVSHLQSSGGFSSSSDVSNNPVSPSSSDASNSLGLLLYNLQNNQGNYVQTSTLSNLLNTTITVKNQILTGSLYLDSSKTNWIAENNGLVQFGTGSNVVATFNPATGIISNLVTYNHSTLPSSVNSGDTVFCTDCYSSLRDSQSTVTGIKVTWNGTSWTDMIGNAISY